ncbi:hypothetical protein OG693_39120 (plasmid) [Streptomyces sp. NBC_01259]|uniref:hypothetical protein n=1 Tax=Streptomyces sp. NBC_01259 TaxID=2903800 RepID=UPI002F9092B0
MAEVPQQPETEPLKAPAEYVESTLRSAIEADLLHDEHINDLLLFEAHSHTVVNGFIAALAMEALRRFAPGPATALAQQLDGIFTRGDIGGPAYRAAKSFGYDPDQWIAKYNQQAAARGAAPQ